MKAALVWINSMAGRMFVILLAGFMISGMFGMHLAGMGREAHLEALHVERAAHRVALFVEMTAPDFSAAAMEAATHSLPGVIPISQGAQGGQLDMRLTASLQAQLPDMASLTAHHAELPVCYPGVMPRPERDHAAREWTMRAPTCWLVRVRTAEGHDLALGVQTPMTIINLPSILDPLFLATLLVAAAILALLLSLLAAAPLRNLTRAAAEMAEDGKAPQIAETGPREMRAAARAFNRMQTHIRERIVYRAEMLAGIAHDLQTPLTRMWLRLEDLPPSAAQLKLQDDLALMGDMVREGLDLTRNREPREDRVLLELDTLIDAIVEDAADAGGVVRFSERSGCEVMVRPLALRRSITNLVDNAVKYAGHAEIAVVKSNAGVEIHVRDRGPGLGNSDNSAACVSVDAPLEGLQQSSGLGLRVAERQATLAGAKLSVRERAGGGVDAVLAIARGP
ncbi:MAG: HAMP domain-containing protein [Hyphomonadaceae bacterium]|nr:HAMP domain-containing protein [Hyphomonadaceae bacterium]